MTTYTGGVVHPDTRFLFIRTDGVGSNILYSGNDGGIDVWDEDLSGSSPTWRKLNGDGLTITEIYGFDMNPNRDWITVGCIDLGYYVSNSGDWVNHLVGDGFKIIFDPYQTTETMYGQNNGSRLDQSTNSGSSWPTLSGDDGSTGTADREMSIDILGNLYMGHNTGIGAAASPKKKLYRRPFGSTTWSEVGYFSGALDRINGIGISKSNPNVVYVGFDAPTWATPLDRVYKTTNAVNSDKTINATPTWTDISANTGVDESGVTDIVVHPNDPNKVWVANGTGFGKGGTSTGKRVYYSSNGGSTFAALDEGLMINETSPLRFPVNVMVMDEATGGLYIGTDIGVYYNPNPESTSSPWVCFNQDFPTAIVTDLKIDYCQRKILASTYGRGLWMSNLAEEPDQDYEITSDYLLNIGTSETRLFYSDITIPSGKTMTVEGTLKMASGRKITIEVGAKIIVDGGTVTSTCDLPWSGIYVEGNSSAIQLPNSNQGYINVINGGTISNAKDAINLFGINGDGSVNWNKVGGIVKTNDANFKNNGRDVAFLSYHQKVSGVEIPNQSQFINTLFQTNSSNFIPNNDLGDHITMFDVYGVKILGCTFEDTRSIVIKSQGRRGIYTIDASFLVNDYCTSPYSPCSTTIESHFTNLKMGIQSVGDGTKGNITIKNSYFNCYRGILLLSTKNSSIIFNDFTIKHDVVVSNTTEYPYGSYIDRCNGFYITENTYSGTTGTANVADGGAAGLVIRNTGEKNNSFYNNNFDHLKVSSEALSANRSSGLDVGLRFRCNEYSENFNDLYVLEDPADKGLSLGTLGMAELQGQYLGYALPSDNEFGNFSSIRNLNIENKGNYMAYIYRGSPTQVNLSYPYDVTLTPPKNLVDRFGGSGLRDCPDNSGGYGSSTTSLMSTLLSQRPFMMTTFNNDKNQTDNGDPDGLADDVKSANPGNVNTVVSNLLSYSPHLSVETLSLVAQQGFPYSNEMILNVMLANPHSARSSVVQGYLDARGDQLNSTYRDSIDDLVNIYTFRDTSQAYVAYLTQTYDSILNELIFGIMSDTTSTVTDLDPWLKHPIDPNFHYTLAEMYYKNGDSLECMLTLDSIPILLDLNNEQTNYHNTMTSLFAQIYEWQGTGHFIHRPDTAIKSWTLGFCDTVSMIPSIANVILAINDSIISTPNVYIPSVSPSMPSESSSIGKLNSTDRKLIMYPNPADEHITLVWNAEFERSIVEVFNSQGSLIMKRKWNKDKEMELKSDTWSEGNYFINIVNDNGASIGSFKVTIIH